MILGKSGRHRSHSLLQPAGPPGIDPCPGAFQPVLTSDGGQRGFQPGYHHGRQHLLYLAGGGEGAFLLRSGRPPQQRGRHQCARTVWRYFGGACRLCVWLHPETGKPLRSGLFADICSPGRPAFREYAVFFHDELEIRTWDGGQPVDPHTGLPSGTTAISYRPSRCATVSP